MEHRASTRIQVEQTAVLDCPRIGGTSITVREINLGGMLVDSTMMFLPMYAPVMVAVSLQDARGTQDFLLDAMVIRHTSTGAVLMLSDLDSTTLRALAAVLYSDRHARRNRKDFSSAPTYARTSDQYAYAG